MNKRTARKQAYDNSMSVADLMALIDAARGRQVLSSVNPLIPHEKALDIYARALALRDPSDVLDGNRSRDVLILTNILRDCA